MIHAYLHFCTDYYTSSVFVIPYEMLLVDMCDTFIKMSFKDHNYCKV